MKQYEFGNRVDWKKHKSAKSNCELCGKKLSFGGAFITIREMPVEWFRKQGATPMSFAESVGICRLERFVLCKECYDKSDRLPDTEGVGIN